MRIVKASSHDGVIKGRQAYICQAVNFVWQADLPWPGLCGHDEVMLEKEKITYLVVHCADTPDEADLQAADIHKMHLGFGWDGAGYHHIIRKDGEIEPGRPRYWQGAHVYGQNENSLGICLIGRSQFTPAQKNSLSRLLHQLKCQYPAAEIVGHRDIQDTHKTCPNFDVRAWWKTACLLQDQTAYILPSSTGLYATPPTIGEVKSVLDTELLSGEAVSVSGQTTEQGFVYVTAQTDGYQGWVKLADLGSLPTPLTANASVCQPFSLITAGQDVKSAYLKSLPFGARLAITGPAEDGFVPVRSLTDNGMPLTGYVADHHLSADDTPHNKDWTSWAEVFIGAPYKWGGRTAAGLDCSALIQLSFAACGLAVPRDTGPQQLALASYALSSEDAFQSCSRGDLIYWDGHVAICIDEENIIHANAHHHSVALEPRDEAIERIQRSAGLPQAHIPAAAIRQL